MPRLTPADASLILDHVVGDASIPTATVNVLLAGLPFPDHPTPRLLRSLLLGRLDTDPVSAAALDSLQLLASLPDPDPAPPVSAAHLAVAAFLAASAPDFDAAARALFARPGGRARRAVDEEEGGDPALASSEALAVADQFEAAVGNAFSQDVLKGLFGDRAKAERRVRDLLAAEWAAIGPSRLELAAEQIVGDGAVETWRAADETVRAKYRILAGEEKSREILSRIEDRISTPQVHKVIHDLKSSCADLHNVVDDPLPAAKAAADEVLAARMDKAVHINDEEVNNQAANCSIAGPSAVNDQGETLRKGTPSSLMDWNPTAKSLLDTLLGISPKTLDFGNYAQRNLICSGRTRLILMAQDHNYIDRTCLAQGEYRFLRCKWQKTRRRRARRWSSVEEETLRNGVEQFGSGNWKDILMHNPDVFIGRTPVDLKDKWRNMMR